MPLWLTPQNANAVLQERIEHIIAQKGRAFVALDGMAASGKTTLCSRLSAILPGCAVVHMDDFFLTQELRDAGYAAREVANSDVGRVRSEVLAPLYRGEDAVYRPYVHHPTPAFLPPVRIARDCPAVIVEGAYSLHPALFDLYDLRVLMCVCAQTQRERILARNGQTLLTRFLSEWIPLENRHIAARELEKRCDAVIRVP